MDYSPAFSKIRDFSIRESNGETKAVYPYLKDGKSVKLESNKFDWNTPDPRIGFKDNMLVAMEGSVGYGIGGARVELEIGYERFKTKGIRDSGSKEDEADTVYLLAKELAYDVVTDQEERLGIALAKYKGEDIVRFAKAVELSSSGIDKKVCKLPDGAKYGEAGHAGVNTCGVGNTNGAKSESLNGALKEFRQYVLEVDKYKHWPITQGATDKDKSNAAKVAGDLTKLSTEEKTIVAGLLAKTIEGGEVVEIRAVSSTYSMVNFGYRN
ncbi:Major surface antigen 4 precursor [Anaplasma phagocytophilum]|nr:Major surface antigen 4 precursor [Anaplasma phagocytophilum]